MKKIFAIALAAVMVLSMASAFAASDCAVWGNNWPCDLEDNTPWCGQGKVEVVPLVKVNTACGWEFQVNECAGAVRSDFIYYAIKLTVDAYPDRDWWTQAGLSLEFWGDDDAVVDVALPISEEDADAEDKIGVLDMDAKKAITYYGILTKSEVEGEQGTETVVEPVWVDLDNDDDEYVEGILALIDDIDEDEAINFKEMAWVTAVPSDDPAFCKNWPDYKICATLASFYDGGSEEDYNKLGDYYYAFEETYPEFADMDEVEDDNEGFTGTLRIWTQKEKNDVVTVTNEVTFAVVDGAIVTPSWADVEGEYDDNDKFYNKVMEDFGFASCGTAACITYLNVQKNFGWNDSQEDCFEWSTKAAAVVDAECVVAIPKTGDASLLAWLF